MTEKWISTEPDNKWNNRTRLYELLKRRKIYATFQATKIAQLKAKQIQILDELKAKQATEIAQLIADQEDELWEAEQSSMNACLWRQTY